MPSSKKPEPRCTPSVSAARPHLRDLVLATAKKGKKFGEETPQFSRSPQYHSLTSASVSSASPARRREGIANKSKQSVGPKSLISAPRISDGHPYLRGDKRSFGGDEASTHGRSYQGSDGDEDLGHPLTIGRPSSAGDRHSDSFLEHSRIQRARRARAKVKLYLGEAVDERESSGRECSEEMQRTPEGHCAQSDTPYMPGSSSMNHARCLAWLRNVPKHPEPLHDTIDYAACTTR